MNKRLVELIRKKFAERMQAKTGWGRVEVMQEFELALGDALIELLDSGANGSGQ